MRELKPQPQPADIAALRELEEMLEVRARRRLLEEEAKNVRQQRARNRVEIGHRRLALIERFLLLGMMLFAFALALVGNLSLPLALLVAGALGGAGVAARKSTEA
jgi:hypothetical protein